MKTYLKAVRKNSFYSNQDYFTLGKTYEAIEHFENLYEVTNDGGSTILTNLDVGYHGFDFELVKEPEEMATEHTKEYKTWGEMTPEEKGALLLAHHEGKIIQWGSRLSPEWWSDDTEPFLYNTFTYRIKPEETKVKEKAFDRVYLEVTKVPYTYSMDLEGTTKGTATVTYTDGKPTKMVWVVTE